MQRTKAHYQYWMGNFYQHDKKHIGMTEEEKANVADCRGIKDDHPCKNPLFRCEKCGNYGCSQPITDKCTEQGFKGDKCLNCGSVGTRIPIMKDEYEKFVEAWDELNAEPEIE